MALVRLITNVAAGKTNPSTIYARIKNGSVYRHTGNCDPAKVPSVIADIKAAGKIRIGGTADGILWNLVQGGNNRKIGIPDDEKGMTDADRVLSTQNLYNLAMRKPLMGADPVAPRFRYLDAFKAKCNKLEAEGNLGALQDLYDRKDNKAHALRTQFEVFQKTMHDTESDWEELDRIQRVMEVVVAERDYASDVGAMLSAPYKGWEDDA